MFALLSWVLRSATRGSSRALELCDLVLDPPYLGVFGGVPRPHLLELSPELRDALTPLRSGPGGSGIGQGQLSLDGEPPVHGRGQRGLEGFEAHLEARDGGDVALELVGQLAQVHVPVFLDLGLLLIEKGLELFELLLQERCGF